MSYDYSEFGGVGLGIAFWLIYMLVLLGVSVAMHVLRSLGMYTIAKRRGINHAWLSWIPVADHYLLGCISDQYQYVVKGKNKSKRKALLILGIVLCVIYVAFIASTINIVANAVTGALNNMDEDALVAGMIGPMFGMMGLSIPLLGVTIALVVVRFMAMYDLYTSCSPQNSVMFLVLSIFFSITEPFFVFCNRKKDDGMPPRRTDYQTYIPEQPREPWEN